MFHRWASVVLASLLLLLGGCSKTYEVSGIVIESDRDHGTITISHEPIDGYMDAMVMPFHIHDAANWVDVDPGTRVEFRLLVSVSTSSIDQIRVISAARADAGLTRSPAIPVLTALGTVVLDFSLIDQNEKAIALSTFRGQVVVVNFIYTRCPLPDYCPLLMTKFAELAKRFSSILGRDLTLLSITFDPKYDTPEVLKQYASRHGVGATGWHLLTGTPQAIQQVAEVFGIEYWPEEGLFTHTLLTAIVDRDGKLFAVLEGKNHTTAQLADLVQAALAR